MHNDLSVAPWPAFVSVELCCGQKQRLPHVDGWFCVFFFCLPFDRLLMYARSYVSLMLKLENRIAPVEPAGFRKHKFFYSNVCFCASSNVLDMNE